MHEWNKIITILLKIAIYMFDDIQHFGWKKSISPQAFLRPGQMLFHLFLSSYLNICTWQSMQNFVVLNPFKMSHVFSSKCCASASLSDAVNFVLIICKRNFPWFPWGVLTQDAEDMTFPDRFSGYASCQDYPEAILLNHVSSLKTSAWHLQL